MVTQRDAEEHSVKLLFSEEGVGESESTALSEKREGRPTAAPHPVTAHEFANCRRLGSGREEFVAHIFQNVRSAFHAYFPTQNWILVFDAENSFVADVHVSLDDGLPG